MPEFENHQRITIGSGCNFHQKQACINMSMKPSNFKCYFEELENKKFDGWIDDKEGRLAMIIICD